MTWLSRILYLLFQRRSSRRNLLRRLDDYATYVQQERK